MESRRAFEVDRGTTDSRRRDVIDSRLKYEVSAVLSCTTRQTDLSIALVWRLIQDRSDFLRFEQGTIREEKDITKGLLCA